MPVILDQNLIEPSDLVEFMIGASVFRGFVISADGAECTVMYYDGHYLNTNIKLAGLKLLSKHNRLLLRSVGD